MSRTVFLSLKSFAMPARGGALLLAAVSFAAGLTTATLLAPVSAGRSMTVAAPPTSTSTRTMPVISNTGHPAEVLRVIDGDTFEARVHVWPA